MDQKDLTYTFYTQPYLLYPRRIHAYLTEKPLPSYITTDLINVHFDKSVMTRPAGKIDGTVPMLRFGPSESDFIRQSIAILNYLEEAHPRGNRDLRGDSVLERARVSELIAVVEDATLCFGFWVMNSSKLFANMGMAQSRDAAKAAKGRMDKQFLIIRDYAVEGKWLVGGEEMTLADIFLGGLVEYARDMYGKDVLEGYEELRLWFKKWENTEAGKMGAGKMPPAEYREAAGTWKW